MDKYDLMVYLAFPASPLASVFCDLEIRISLAITGGQRYMSEPAAGFGHPNGEIITSRDLEAHPVKTVAGVTTMVIAKLFSQVLKRFSSLLRCRLSNLLLQQSNSHQPLVIMILFDGDRDF